MNYLINEDQVRWGEHPSVKQGKFALLFSKDEGSRATIVMVKLPKGAEHHMHDHGESDDILYILRGKAKMEVEGVGSFDLKKGSVFRAPAHVRHRLYDITEELVIYGVYVPPNR